MRQLLIGAAVLMQLAGPAAAEGHGWTREAGPSFRYSFVPDTFQFLSATTMGDSLITLWERPAFEDEEERDFLGNPLQVNRTFLRCVEERGEDGVFRMQYCETQ